MDNSVIANVLGSASAGIISRICTHPLDTAKARLQAISGTTYGGPLDVLVKTARNEGLTGLYRGFGAVVIGGTPGTVLYLTSYDFAKQQLITRTDGISHSASGNLARDFAVHFSSGMIAEAIACVVYVPVDVVKERLQVSNSIDASAYKGSWDALVKISQTEGIPALYKGYGATLLSFGSYSGLFFLFYEQMLARARKHLFPKDEAVSSHASKGREIPFQWTLICSCGAGALASWLTSPLDMAKLRLQVQRGQQAAAASGSQPRQQQQVVYNGLMDCLVSIYHQGGVRGLFRGAGARVLHFAPATTVTITSYEVCRSFFAKRLDG